MINKKKSSPAGNRTPVSRVTGGDTHHYTTEDFRTRLSYIFLFYFIIVLFSPVRNCSPLLQSNAGYNIRR